jgi:hypothetical protein
MEDWSESFHEGLRKRKEQRDSTETRAACKARDPHIGVATLPYTVLCLVSSRL